MSYTGNTQFLVAGNWTVQVAPGRKVVINGMYNQLGGIAYNGVSTERGTHVTIIGSHFVDGSLSFNDASCVLDLFACTLEHGIVRMNYGNVVGNDITTNFSAPLMFQGGGGFHGDTCLVMGNKLRDDDFGGSGVGIRIAEVAQILHVRNNYIRSANTAIEVYENSTSVADHRLWNNTLLLVGSTGMGQTGVELAILGSNSTWDLRNNLIVDASATGSSNGIHSDAPTSGTVTVLYNHLSGLDEPITAGFTLVGFNTTTGTTNVDFEQGTVGLPSSITDGADPDPTFTDLDLSPGDAGAYGGSYTLTNFFPTQVNGARITHVVLDPNNVRQGTGLLLRALAIDR